MKKRLLLSTTFLVCSAGAAAADPVTGAIALAFGGGATALAVAQVVVGLGLNIIGAALTKALAGKPKIDVNFEAQIGDDLPLSFIVGDFVTAGKRKYVGSWGPNTRYIVEVFEVSALPQPGNPSIWVNDEVGVIKWGETGTFTDQVVTGRELRTRDGHSGGGSYYVNTYTTKTTTLGTPIDNYKKGDGDYRMWIKWVDGSQTTADPYLRDVFGSHPDHPYDANMIGKGKTYAIITTRYDADTMTSAPSVLFKPAPLRLYDPRKDTSVGGSGPHRWGNQATYEETRNNAVIAYNIARGIYYGTEWVFGGQNLAAWRLPLADWVVAMNSCDAVVSLVGGGTEPSYRCGAEISVDMEPLAVMEQIGLAANMRYAEVGGRLKPLVGLPGASVFSFSDDDLLVTAGQDTRPFAPMAETINSITATYPEPDQRWKSKDAPEAQISNWLARDGQYLPTAVNYSAAPYQFQVQRLMLAQLLDAQRQIIHEFSLPPVAYGIEPFDLVTWTSVRNGYIGKTFIVEAVTKLIGMGVQVVLKEVNPADYDWTTANQRPTNVVPPTTEVPVYNVVGSFSASGVAIADDTSRTRVAAVEITCSSDIAGVDDLLIEIRKVGVDNPVVAVRRPFATPYRWVVAGVAPSTAYLVRVKPVSQYASGEWTAELTVTTPSVLVPVEGLDPLLVTRLDNLNTVTADAKDRLDKLTNGLVTDIDGALASIEARTRAGLDGWLTDPIFSRWTSGNLTSTYWLQRTGTSVYASKVAGLFGSAIFIDVPAGTTPVQFIARSDLETNGMKGVDPDAPFVVVTVAVEYISGIATNPTLRPEWSNDLVNWTRGDLQVAANAVGSFTQLGISIKPGVVQTVEAMWKRPAGTFAYVRLIGYPKSTANTVATQQVWHLMQIRAASEAERNAWTIPSMQATIDTHETAISGPTGAIAVLTTNLSATNTLASGKGKVLSQSTAPAAGDQLPQNLWIDTTGGNNTPKRWNGTAWVAVTDKTAIDAAAAASAAQLTANDIAANLSTNYLTATTTNTALAALKTALEAGIDPYRAQKLHADFRVNDFYWAQGYVYSAATLPLGAYPTVAFTDVNLVSVAGIGQVLQAGPAAAARNISERFYRPFVVGQKMRFRMKTRLTANPTTGSHSTRLYFVMTDSAGAYLGLTGVIANFTGTLAADGWVVKEFVFDPEAIKSAGAYASTAVNWRVVIQISGLNSANQQIEWFELEDITADTALQAAITNIQAVDVSALTGTALATLLTQLGVAAGGSSAWITSQTSAVADLEGNAAASYVLRVGAGGASAGVELVAADDPIFGAASSLKLSAKHLEILASSVRISDNANLFPDFDMVDPLYYSTSDGAAFTFVGTATATLGKNFLNIAASAAPRSVASGWFPIEPGAEYLVSGAAFMSSTASGQGTATLTIETGLVDAAGAVSVLTSNVVETRANLNYSGTLAQISLVAGATARRARFKLTRAANGAGAARASGFKVQKKAGASLLVDGLFAVTGMAVFGGALQSSNYIAGFSGWRITDAGGVEFNDLVVRESMIVNGAATEIARCVDVNIKAITASASWTEIGRLTIPRRAGCKTDFQVTINFDGYGNGVLVVGLFRGIAASSPFLESIGNTLGGRQDVCSFAGVDTDTGSGSTVYLIKARKADPAVSGGWNANLRAIRVYMTAQQFKK